MTRVRRARREDAVAIARVHVRSWKEAYPGLVPQPYLDSLTPQSRLASWEELLDVSSGDASETLVLLDGNAGGEKIVGFVTFTIGEEETTSRTGEVLMLYLDPQWWGKGAGAALLQRATAELAESGAQAVTLWVLGVNERARRFYERLGWRPDGATKRHDWKDFVATDVRYRLELCQ